MPRAFCYQCRRAKVTCLCGRIEKQPNEIKIIVLQHPDEVSNSKASAIIAELGLLQYQRWIAKDFSEHAELIQLLSDAESKVAILYPTKEATELSSDGVGRCGERPEYLIVIDATWRKAKKIWELQPLFHKLPIFRLGVETNSNYRIRKVPQEGYLSTLESIVFALRALEKAPHAYQSLLELFDEMIDSHIEKMGEAVYQKNYSIKNKLK